jgi:uncharacterized delta-60 repeat protein
MHRTLLGKVIARREGPRRSGGPAGRRRPPLGAEPLEDRVVPSTGLLDPSFGSGGIVLTPLGTSGALVHGVAVQPNGKIVVAGSAVAGGQDVFAVTRYNANGTLDSSFHHTGEALTPFGAAASAAYAVALQPDGKIVVVGMAGTHFALARYNADGSLDPAFGHGGQVVTAFTASTAFANAVALEADGKILVAGDADSSFAIARYNADGSIDTHFAFGGLELVHFNTGEADARGVALEPDGKAVVAGTVSNGYWNSFAVARLNADGTLDRSFGGWGGTTFSFAPNEAAAGLALPGGGKILVAGSNNGSFALARLNPDGTLDTSFNGTGEATTNFGGSYAQANSLALAVDGKILVAGTAYADDAQRFDFALARFNGNGTLDTGFNGTGTVTTDVGTDAEADALAVQGDGKVVLAGTASGDAALARYIPGPGAPAPTATRTALSSSADPAVFGEAVTFTAVVAPLAGGGTPAGTVTFLDGGTVLGTVPLVGGRAEWTTRTLAVGIHADVTASYSGGGGFAASTSAELGQVVDAAHTTTLVTAPNGPALFGQPLTLTARVGPVAPGAGVPTGVVVFLDGPRVLGSRRLVGGEATLTVQTPLSLGLHHIRAVYFGSADFTASMSPVLAEAVKAATTTVVAIAPGSTNGTAFMATVTAGDISVPRRTGTVTFKDGTTVLGTVPLGPTEQAVLTLASRLAAGRHTITASYSGDGDFLASISLPLVVVVGP